MYAKTDESHLNSNEPIRLALDNIVTTRDRTLPSCDSGIKKTTTTFTTSLKFWANFFLTYDAECILIVISNFIQKPYLVYHLN